MLHLCIQPFPALHPGQQTRFYGPFHRYTRKVIGIDIITCKLISGHWRDLFYIHVNPLTS